MYKFKVTIKIISFRSDIKIGEKLKKNFSAFVNILKVQFIYYLSTIKNHKESSQRWNTNRLFADTTIQHTYMRDWIDIKLEYYCKKKFNKS